MLFFNFFHRKIDVPDPSRGVSAIEIEFVVENCQSGSVNVTDIMLQGGTIATMWTGHPSEMRWSLDG